jgi:hypothetical protein
VRIGAKRVVVDMFRMGTEPRCDLGCFGWHPADTSDLVRLRRDVAVSEAVVSMGPYERHGQEHDVTVLAALQGVNACCLHAGNDRAALPGVENAAGGFLI